ncbi:MAG: hypothetical protein M1834_009181 [Cirrosporium novae-zelandiae]|nr:MAG: hypothetical protein M1834_009181 [Cirrosporium novae-zelandiae]
MPTDKLKLDRNILASYGIIYVESIIFNHAIEDVQESTLRVTAITELLPPGSAYFEDCGILSDSKSATTVARNYIEENEKIAKIAQNYTYANATEDTWAHFMQTNIFNTFEEAYPSMKEDDQQAQSQTSHGFSTNKDLSQLLGGFRHEESAENFSLEVLATLRSKGLVSSPLSATGDIETCILPVVAFTCIGLEVRSLAKFTRCKRAKYTANRNPRARKILSEELSSNTFNFDFNLKNSKAPTCHISQKNGIEFIKYLSSLKFDNSQKLKHEEVQSTKIPVACAWSPIQDTMNLGGPACKRARLLRPLTPLQPKPEIDAWLLTITKASRNDDKRKKLTQSTKEPQLDEMRRSAEDNHSENVFYSSCWDDKGVEVSSDEADLHGADIDEDEDKASEDASVSLHYYIYDMKDPYTRWLDPSIWSDCENDSFDDGSSITSKSESESSDNLLSDSDDDASEDSSKYEYENSLSEVSMHALESRATEFLWGPEIIQLNVTLSMIKTLTSTSLVDTTWKALEL